jgi:hypothetical protein
MARVIAWPFEAEVEFLGGHRRAPFAAWSLWSWRK